MVSNHYTLLNNMGTRLLWSYYHKGLQKQHLQKEAYTRPQSLVWRNFRLWFLRSHMPWDASKQLHQCINECTIVNKRFITLFVKKILYSLRDLDPFIIIMWCTRIGWNSVRMTAFVSAPSSVPHDIHINANKGHLTLNLVQYTYPLRHYRTQAEAHTYIRSTLVRGTCKALGQFYPPIYVYSDGKFLFI